MYLVIYRFKVPHLIALSIVTMLLIFDLSIPIEKSIFQFSSLKILYILSMIPIWNVMKYQIYTEKLVIGGDFSLSWQDIESIKENSFFGYQYAIISTTTDSHFVPTSSIINGKQLLEKIKDHWKQNNIPRAISTKIFKIHIGMLLLFNSLTFYLSSFLYSYVIGKQYSAHQFNEYFFVFLLLSTLFFNRLVEFRLSPRDFYLYINFLGVFDRKCFFFLWKDIESLHTNEKFWIKFVTINHSNGKFILITNFIRNGDELLNLMNKSIEREHAYE